MATIVRVTCRVRGLRSQITFAQQSEPPEHHSSAAGRQAKVSQYGAMRHRVITLATCNLDQWAMDFKGNLERVIESIKRARELGAAYRVSCGMHCQSAAVAP